jgi:hypothetical protein
MSIHWINTCGRGETPQVFDEADGAGTTESKYNSVEKYSLI